MSLLMRALRNPDRVKTILRLRALQAVNVLGGLGQQPAVWIDVGAHHGETTMHAAERNPRLTVYAFEPNLAIAKSCMGRLPNFIMLPLAITEEDGHADLRVNAYTQASSLLPMDPEILSSWTGGDVLVETVLQPVPTMRLDTFMNRMGIASVDFLKIDAQGADLAVVRSAGDRLRDIRRIQAEVAVTSRPLYDGGATKAELVSHLTQAGFTCTETIPQSYGQEENLVFTRNA